MATTRIACVRQEDEAMLTYFKTHHSAMVLHLPPQQYEHMQHAADEVLARLLRSINGKTLLEILDSNAEGVLEDVRTLRVTHGATGHLINRLSWLLETNMDASTSNYVALKNTISTSNGKLNSLHAKLQSVQASLAKFDGDRQAAEQRREVAENIRAILHSVPLTLPPGNAGPGAQ